MSWRHASRRLAWLVTDIRRLLLIDFDKIALPPHLHVNSSALTVCEHLISLLPGRRVLIDEAAFFAWVERQGAAK